MLKTYPSQKETDPFDFITCTQHDVAVDKSVRPGALLIFSTPTDLQHLCCKALI